MNRRQLVQVTAGTALAHTFVTVLGCEAASSKAPATPGAGQAAPEHHGHGAQAVAASPVSAELRALAGAAAECVTAGEACLEHCLRSLSSGSTMMADCAKAVQQMLAVCRAAQSLAAMGSRYAREIAALCARACADCAGQCEPHVGHHAECKACFDACKRAEAAARALA